MTQTLNRKLEEPEITLELLNQVVEDSRLTEDYSELTKYILATCLLRGDFSDDMELSDYIKSLKRTKVCKYLKEKEN